MITRSGLVETDSGWILAATAVAPGMVMLQLQYDPHRDLPSHGVKQVRCTTDEARELGAALDAAVTRATSVPLRKREQHE